MGAKRYVALQLDDSTPAPKQQRLLPDPIVQEQAIRISLCTIALLRYFGISAVRRARSVASAQVMAQALAECKSEIPKQGFI